MLDLLFLLGDSKTSTTLLDNSLEDGVFNVNESIPRLERVPEKVWERNTEPRVRIDRTSQLLVSMSITIADFVKQHYLRNNQKSKSAQNEIQRLNGFESIVTTTVVDKSSLLTLLLSIEIFFFSKRNNEAL